jgi:predicted metal-dependent phosphoesterase TrpH
MLVDIHAKTSLSDEVDLSVDDVLDTAVDRGLDAVAFCETLSTSYCRRVLEKAEDYDLEVFIGVEIPTDTGNLIGFAPEIDDFYTAEKWRRYTDFAHPTPEAVLEMFDRVDGAVVAARPYDRSSSFVMGDHIFDLERLDAVEVVNSRVAQIHNDFAVEAATYLGLPTVGGSDPSDSTDVVGDYGTFFDVDPTSQGGFVDALRNRDYWAVELGASD